MTDDEGANGADDGVSNPVDEDGRFDNDKPDDEWKLEPKQTSIESSLGVFSFVLRGTDIFEDGGVLIRCINE